MHDNTHEQLQNQRVPTPWQSAQMLEQQILREIGCADAHEIHNIKVDDNETIHTIFIKGKNKSETNIYLGHGFGGSSLTYFHCFDQLREKGNIVIWQIRGMGLNEKPTSYQIPQNQISSFYSEGFSKVLEHYNHQNIVLLNHSFSAYITMRHLLHTKNPNIKKLILLSPVGLTPKDQDDKNSIKSFKDIWDVGLNKFGWKFNLTYKSPMRTLLFRWKEDLLFKSFQKYDLEVGEAKSMAKIFDGLISLKDGSENLFFKYFHPRVLPRNGESIIELLGKNNFHFPTSIFYGQNDWVDRKGANNLASNNTHIQVHIVQQCDHMIPFSKKTMSKIIDQEL